MLITVDPGSDTPLFEQISDAIRLQVANGTLVARAKLPAARDLADQLGVNIHTVLKAYQMLRNEGLVELRRGRGAMLTEKVTSIGTLTGPVDELLETANEVGIELESLVALLRTRSQARGT